MVSRCFEIKIHSSMLHFSQGDQASSFYIVESGTVKIFKEDPVCATHCSFLAVCVCVYVFCSVGACVDAKYVLIKGVCLCVLLIVVGHFG